VTKYLVTVNGKTHAVQLLERKNSLLSFRVGKKNYSVDIRTVLEERSKQQDTARLQHKSSLITEKGETTDAKDVCAPMPGIIVSVAVSEGDSVEPGQTLLVMEAMKMENNISAQRSGQVKKVHIAPGEEVVNHQVLITLE